MNHDVAIVGGGLVGLALACALGADGRRVALIEARPLPRPLPRSGQPPLRGRPEMPVASEPAPIDASPIDTRVSAISRASEAWLRTLGAWQRLPADWRCGFERMTVWDAGSRGEVAFSGADVGLDVIGTIVENRALTRALEACVAELASVRWYRPASLRSVDFGAAQAVLQLEDARLRTRLLVGADGAQSLVRQQAGIRTTAGEFRQVAVVANFVTGSGHRRTAWQRFLPTGPLALLPLPDDQVSMVWSTTVEHAAELLRLDADALGRAVETAVDGRVRGIRAVSPAASFPLRFHAAQRYVGHRVALVGDAAHAIHPLAGQGVNLGFLDAAALAQVITALAARGRDPGRVENIRRYQRWRIGHNRLMGQATRAFHHVFTSTSAPVQALRGLGFALTDRVGPLKRLFASQATGLQGDLPGSVRAALARLEAD